MSPLLGWLICMLAAAGVFAVAVGVDLRCQQTAGVWAWSLVEISLMGAAAAFVIWAMRWHGQRWLLLLVPLAVVTLAAFGFVLWEAWGVTTNCNVAYLDFG